MRKMGLFCFLEDHYFKSILSERKRAGERSVVISEGKGDLMFK